MRLLKRWILVSAVFFNVLLSYGQMEEIIQLKKDIETQQGVELIISLNELSWQYRNIDVDSALLYAKRSLKISEEISDELAMSTSFNNIASAYEAIGLYDSAELYHTNALGIQENFGDSIKAANSYNNLGIVFDQKGLYGKALLSYFKALEYYERASEDPSDVAKTLVNIGIVYKKQLQYDLVFEYYEKALAIYESEESDFGVTVIQGNIGAVLINLGQYEESKSYSFEAMAGYERLNYKRYIPYILSNLGAAEDSLHNYTEARNYYRQSINQHLDFNNRFEIAATSLAMAISYLKTGETNRAIEMCNEAIKWSKEIEANEIQASSYKVLASAYSQNSEYEQAYISLLSHLTGNDSLFEESKIKLIFDLETKYQTEKKEQEIEIQKLSLAEKDLTIQRDTFLQATMGVVVVSLIGLGFLQRNRLKLKQANLLTEEKRKMQEKQIDAIIQSIEKERKRFSEDLHDGFGQYLSILRMNLDGILQKMPALGKTSRNLFEHSKKTLREMNDELKNICFNLMPKTLIQHGIDAALKEFGFKVSQAGKTKLEVITFGFEEGKRLGDLYEISLYRISQEWVNNILKYGAATKITLQLIIDENEISLTIEDDGPGFNPDILSRGKGNGWKNIQSRVNLLKGEVEIDSREGIKGSTLMVQAPIQANVS